MLNFCKDAESYLSNLKGLTMQRSVFEMWMKLAPWPSSIQQKCPCCFEDINKNVKVNQLTHITQVKKKSNICERFVLLSF